ncbi:hypothetical protein YC2023_064034 [Brassica napus]
MKRGSYSSLLSSYGGASFHRRRRRSGVTSAAHSVASASERRDFSCHGRSCVRRKARRESLHRKKLRVIEKEDGDGNSNTGSCTDHIPEINIILLPAKTETHMKNMIQVSSTKKSLFFYVNLAPSLHTAITMVVTIFEILKNIGLTTKKSKFFFFHDDRKAFNLIQLCFFFLLFRNEE